MTQRSLHSRDGLVLLQCANYSPRTSRHRPTVISPVFDFFISYFLSNASSWSAGILQRPPHGRLHSRYPGLWTWTPWPPRPGVASSTLRPDTGCSDSIITRMPVQGSITITIITNPGALSPRSRKSPLPHHNLRPLGRGCNPQ
uniref:Uncharacterized protein n=2 Tax=Cacopsylla melanoneura TaxID=428564 RepID=A0A8D8W0L6_9HEMI